MVQDVFKIMQGITHCPDENIREAKRKINEEGFTESRALFESKCGTKEEVLKAMSFSYKIPALGDISDILIGPEDIDIVGADNILNLKFIPYRKEKRITLLIVDPKNIMNIEDLIKTKYNIPIRFVIIMEVDYQNWLRQLGIDEDSTRLNTMLLDLTYENPEEKEEDIVEVIDYDSISVVNIVNRFIVDAVQKKASDIHIEPMEKLLRIRFRIDGILSVQAEIDKAIHKQLVNRIKVMSNLDSTNSMTPQSGKLHLVFKGKSIDARVSTLPGIYGETVTMRLINNDVKIPNLESLGFDTIMSKKMRRLMSLSNGIILITGPTGSGKSSTLAAIISELNTVDKSIITIEDPVEYRIAGISQVNINNSMNLTFASVLRESLRQDPDIIMIGEIRDTETARIAISASNTGHLVLSTLHTNSAATSAVRLSEMGVEPFMVGSTIRGIVNQKLVRVLCPHCKEEYIVNEESDLYKYYPHEEKVKAFKSVGCTKCHGLGYVGRTIILEYLEITPEISRLLLKNANADEIEEAAIKNGMIKAREYALSLVHKGITSLEEVDRVLSSGI